MHEDNLERADVEHAIRHGAIEKRYTSDPRGTRVRVAPRWMGASFESCAGLGNMAT